MPASGRRGAVIGPLRQGPSRARWIPTARRCPWAEMPVHRRLAEEWAAQVELLDDAQRAQVEELGDGGGDRRLGNTSRAEGIDPNRNRLDDTHRVRDLDLTFAPEACCHDVLGDVPGAVRAGPIDLRRALAREASAAVAGIPPLPHRRRPAA